ncbi:helix-turn-helix transcriptional regulator [Streptomyces sp. HNM0663]|uniref:Helix-turn-helix transcriptional regulator n=1 Tax=Streptomyces chengmaiensis TaxID=3040919 RepID=A0ABT6HJT2_9ACTN|nr:helix-turn-helix transcriptional regulator [Streptomyces chengmaiensis]MDH2389008.1 helix-turn-helix transcriptional regulator [Streptomyces chengmaiensis]
MDDSTTDPTDPTNPMDLEDDSGAVLKTVGKQIRLWRETAKMRQAELARAIGYSDEQVSSVECGRRTPSDTFLEKADEVLGAGGKIAQFKEDVAETRFPHKARNLVKLETKAVEIGWYGTHNLHGLLQTEEYARALYAMRRPTYTEDEIEGYVAARVARHAIFERKPVPALTFVQEESTLRRPLGGRMVLRRQLEHLIALGELRHVELQVMPTETEEHAGMGGDIKMLKLKDGAVLGYSEGYGRSRLTANPKVVRVLELQYGSIRAQALTPRESLAFIEKLLGET